MQAEDRRFFAGLLQENFEDLPSEACSEEALQEAKRWQRFLHDDDEHIKVVRGFQSGRREFRTLHAMYRSETGGTPPYHGLHQETEACLRLCLLKCTEASRWTVCLTLHSAHGFVGEFSCSGALCKPEHLRC
ncbi:unnamed protein product [Symbiodinium pilosum]|uniref:Uncharacterized protein n=1 Tax=Symbiodinium pilosum TaxID=2952 RepID=A0A812VJ37_SYMPI|nr:unnamed protein product [Symbiodinium pilosum]